MREGAGGAADGASGARPLEPAAGEGFFIADLGEQVLGPEWYEGALAGLSPPPRAAARAAEWLNPWLLDAEYAEDVRAAFVENEDGSEGGVAHVCLGDPLLGDRADAVYEALESAAWTRHRHPGYEVDVARAGGQPEALAAFVAWLGSREAASFHAWLAGRLLPPDLEVQVQAARARAGDRFPLHEDTGRPGLAAVYNLTRGFTAEMGGVLRFAGDDGRTILSAPPRFNSVLLFEPRGAPHEVTEILPAAGDRTRFTVTAFYLDGGSAESGEHAT